MTLKSIPTMVASDIDGTLLGIDERISIRTISAINRAQSVGVKFVLVTARPPRWIRPIIDGLDVPPLAVCVNGGALYDSAADEILHPITFTADEVAKVIEVARDAICDVGFGVERLHTTHEGVALDPFVTEPNYTHTWPNPDNVVGVLSDLYGEPALKILIRCTRMSSVEMIRVLDPLIGQTADLTFSHGDGLLEVAPHGVDKARGLARVVKIFQIEPGEIIAFGDMPNDIGMLQWVGHGVAMKNAHPSVLSIADEIADTNENDGVAKVLERWF